MRNSVRFVMLVLAAVVSLSRPATARWRLDTEGGAMIRASSIGFSGRTVDADTAGSFAFGGGYSLNDYVELGGQFQQSISVQIFDDSFDVSTVTAGARVYLLPQGRVRPWLVGQIGWYRVDASLVNCVFFCNGNEHDDRVDNSFGLNVGGGLDVAVSKLISLGVDVRYHDAVSAFGGTGFVTSMFDVGFHFGGD
jgi:opacity protein-like surface antigen